MTQIRLENLRKRFGEVEAVRGIDLTIMSGELAVLVGPSGCGKSTTLRMIAGLEEVSAGRILFDGEPVEHLRPKERDIAMVFQSYALYPHMTVRGNMAFGLRMKGVGRAEQNRLVNQAAELLNIAELLDRKPRELSGGQRQRVAMGRALVRNPRAFLFDEPLSNLDAALRAQMRTEIKRIHQRLGATMIYVTHDQIEATTLADRIVVMNHGRIEQIGQPFELYQRPVNRFVAGFIGSPRMNMFPALITREGSRYSLRIGGGFNLPVPPPCAPALDGREGRFVEAGLRPEHLCDEPGSGSLASSLEVTIDVIEPMGTTNLIHFSLDGQSYMALANPMVVRRPGDKLKLWIDLDHLLLFDPETGECLERQDIPAQPRVAAGKTRGRTQ